MIWKKKKDASAEAAETTEAKSGVSAFAKKNWKWLVPVVVVAAAGAVFLIGGGNKAASGDVTYAETTPTRQDVSNSLSGTGTLNPANTYTVKSLVDGKILTGGFEEGDKVEEGDVLYTIDSSDASTNLEKASIALQQAQRSYDKTVDLQYVRAEVDGTVSSLKVAKGDQVTSGQEVAVIRDSSKMLLNLLFPAADAANFSVGQSADVVLDGTFETLKGTVTAVTGTDELSTGNLLVRTVTIRVNNDHRSGRYRQHQRRQLHRLRHLCLSGRAHPDRSGQRHRFRHQCAGGRRGLQGRHPHRADWRRSDRIHPVCFRVPAQRRDLDAEPAGQYVQLHHHLAHQRHHH